MDCGNWLSMAKEGIVKLAGFPWTHVCLIIPREQILCAAHNPGRAERECRLLPGRFSVGFPSRCVLPPLLSDKLAEGLVYHMDRRSNLGVCERHTACFTPGGQWFA